ncbi:hypothetical protein GF369_01650 [Candidatus Peregrinibacteria bacterium]|nr:hypothetical protein [Candidatus Peregrinibacteria bacterium]
MRVSYSKAPSAKPDMLVCPVFDHGKKKSIDHPAVRKAVGKMKKDKLFQAKNGTSVMLYPSSKNLPKRLLVIGLGKKSKASETKVRNTLAKLLKGYQKKDINSIALLTCTDINQYLQAVVEGMLLINYNPAQYKTGKNRKKVQETLFKSLTIVGSDITADERKAVKRAQVLSESVDVVRDLVNGAPNHITVDAFADKAKKIAKKNKYSIKVYNKSWITKKGMGALLSVNSGSGSKSARLVVMEYKPKKKSKKAPILLVGKGLIFDAGGYNLKPSKYIEDMHQDKAGGSLVVGVFNALKALNINRRVIGIVPLTENLIDADAQKPSDVVTSYSGKTVEIRNTDAEGRMILADALTYGIETYKPEYTIDFATLTGACVVALGDRYAGLMGNNESLVEKIKKAGDNTDELAWKMPIHDDFREAMKGKVADLRNIDDETSSMAGASKAAAFLEHFVGKNKWAHLDIAGVAYNKKPKDIDHPFATGYGVRMMIDFLENC